MRKIFNFIYLVGWNIFHTLTCFPYYCAVNALPALASCNLIPDLPVPVLSFMKFSIMGTVMNSTKDTA